HQALVGIRSTMGLTSRAGVAPLNLLADIAGPIARSVEDAVAVFQVIVGEDPDDPVTAASRGRAIPNYAASLVRDGLNGARIGVLRQAYERPTMDAEIVSVFTKALADLKSAGADIVDPAVVDLEQVQRDQNAGVCMGFKYDINTYLGAQGDRVPVRSLEEIIKSRRFHPSVQVRLETAQASSTRAPGSAACRDEMRYRAAFAAAVQQTMDTLKLDGFVYP